MLVISETSNGLKAIYNGRLTLFPYNSVRVESSDFGYINFTREGTLLFSEYWENIIPHGIDQNSTIEALSFINNPCICNDLSMGLKSKQLYTAYVSSLSTNDTEDGSMEAPYKTIQAALDYLGNLELTPSDRTRIIIINGMYDEHTITIPDKLTTLSVYSLEGRFNTFIRTNSIVFNNSIEYQFIIFEGIWFNFTNPGSNINVGHQNGLHIQMHSCQMEFVNDGWFCDTDWITALVFSLSYANKLKINISSTLDPNSLFLFANNNFSEGIININGRGTLWMNDNMKMPLTPGLDINCTYTHCKIERSQLNNFTHNGVLNPEDIAAELAFNVFGSIYPGSPQPTYNGGVVTLTDGWYFDPYNQYSVINIYSAQPI